MEPSRSIGHQKYHDSNLPFQKSVHQKLTVKGYDLILTYCNKEARVHGDSADAHKYNYFPSQNFGKLSVWAREKYRCNAY
jgi:hypothetical protein